MKDLTYKGFRRVGPERWRKNISHVRDKVKKNHCWIADNLQEYIEEFIIHLGGESNDSSEEESRNSGSDGSVKKKNIYIYMKYHLLCINLL